MDGSNLKELIEIAWTYFWFLMIAIFGGTASYLSRVKKKGLPFSVVELVGEWVVAGFAGLMTLHLCLDAGFNVHLTAFFTGMAGHMGGRIIYLFENLVVNRLPK